MEKAVKPVRKDDKKARRNTKVLKITSVMSATTAIAANQPEIPINVAPAANTIWEFCEPAEVSENLTTTTETPQHRNLQNIKTSPSIDLQTYDEVTYKKKDDVCGVSYTDENGLAGYTLIVYR